MSPSGRPLRLAVGAGIGLGLFAPILLGLWQTLRAAFGVLPALGFTQASLDPWRQLFALPGFAGSLRLTLVTGLGSTLLALVLAVGAAALIHERLRPALQARLLTPFLAVPHAAMAVGLAFVLAPSGWIARALAGPLGWQSPPDLALVNDGWGVALMLGLLVKELPFLLLVMLAGLAQLPVATQMAAGRALGQPRGSVWLQIILPQLWPLVRLPVWVVLAYGLSVVDMAIILGPSTPPTLAVAVTRWFASPDPAMLRPASAGALLQAGIVAAAIALLAGAEAAMRALSRRRSGHRRGRGRWATPCLNAAAALAAGLAVLATLALLSLLVWSLAWRWPFPHLLPQIWSGQAWTGAAAGWSAALGRTLLLALASVMLSLLLAVAWLESGLRQAALLVYAPLLVPQIGFLYGLNVVFLQVGLSGGYLAVIWAHGLFVFPYVMITLTDPWRAVDRRLLDAAAALGAGRWRRLVAVRLPILLRPILTAAAVGVAVSVAQYLPTLFMGAGRIATLTTEAVTLSSGSDRRITAVYASLQAALPLAAYLAAFLIPALIRGQRSG